MKRIYAAILIAIFGTAFHNICNAQWIPIYQDSNAQFYDAAFPTNHTGYVAATDTGGVVVLRTGDGGIMWNKKYISGWDHIDKIAMWDSMTGYLIKGGSPIRILKTNDGFMTYTQHYLDSCYSVQALELLNDSTGFYLNNETRLRKFKRNGTSYFHIIDTLFDGQNLQFVNSHTGFLDNGTRLLMTSDTGATWSYVNNNLGFYCVGFKFSDSLNGYFHDGDIIYKTSDGGVSFPLQFNFPGASTFSAFGNYCMAANNVGNIAYTIDGGFTWQSEITGINLIAPETYTIKNTPGGDYFLFSAFSGEIRKRQPIIAGISNPTDESHILIFPNPTADYVNIKSDIEIKKIRITDQYGRVIKNSDSKENRFFIGDLKSGLYFVTLIDINGFSLIKKVVKK